MKTRFGRGVGGAVLGALPGVVMVLIAQFVITGEWQLTIGSVGIMIGLVGALVGAILGATLVPRR